MKCHPLYQIWDEPGVQANILSLYTKWTSPAIPPVQLYECPKMDE